MTRRLMTTLLMLRILLLPISGTAAEDEHWRLEKDAEGIQVWTRPVEGSAHRAVRARMIVETSAAELAAIIRDTEACREWAQFCAESFVHEALSPSEAFVYTLNDMPWPVTDRDALTHVRWSADPETGGVRMDAEVREGIMAPKRGRVRLTNARSSWTLTPRTDAGVEVISEAHVDPAGPVPAWITNRLLVDAPFETMHRLRALAATGRYAGASLEFLDARSR